MTSIPLVLAFYLPQFHPIPENDAWHGKGFTEWTNVKKAKPLFKGHHQPLIPGELGYYNLLDSKIRIRQAELAQQHGIFGFCYYHYWFGERKLLLERPAEEVLKSKKPKFPFCFCWANESWKGVWHGAPKRILIEQRYPGKEDIQHHLNYLIKFFNDDRYIKVDDKPLFVIHRINPFNDNPDILILYKELLWKLYKLEMYVIGGYADPDENYVKKNIWDDKITSLFQEANSYFLLQKKASRLFKRILPFRKPFLLEYRDVSRYMSKNYIKRQFIPLIVPNWDDSPRIGKKSALVLKNQETIDYKIMLKSGIFSSIHNQKEWVFIKSWNEWGEGNYLEPDRENGYRMLKATYETIKSFESQ